MFNLTTGQCADILNELVGTRVYSSDFILGQVRSGLLEATYRKGGRVRAICRIRLADFRAYIAQHHPDLLGAYDETVTRNSGLAS